MKRAALLLLLSLLVCAPRGAAAGMTAFDSEQGQQSYSIGYQVGGDFKRQQLEIRLPALLKGLTDALQGSEPALSQEQMRAALRELQTIVSERKPEERNRSGEKPPARAFPSSGAQPPGGPP